MKLQQIPLDQIVWNPWRDKSLYPISEDQIAGLRQSIKDHGFFASVKGRRRNGKVELGCGHARLAAARKAGIDTMPIFIGELDDDEMLRLMTDENALQSGANPGAVMNEVAAVIRRLIEGLAGGSGTNVPQPVRHAFESKLALEQAGARLRKRLTDPDADLPIGHGIIRAYLGPHRGERQIREAIAALKQSGRYDDIADEALRKFPPPVDPKAKANGTEVAKTKSSKPRQRIYDERCARAFVGDHQSQAFREAVTTRAAQQFIPVNQQYALAKQIMAPQEDRPMATKKQIGGPYIKRMVQAEVEQAAKAQRNIDKQERERYLAEQREARIDDELTHANAGLRSLVSALAKLMSLAQEFPGHPKLGGFSAKLDDLVDAIKQFSRKLK